MTASPKKDIKHLICDGGWRNGLECQACKHCIPPQTIRYFVCKCVNCVCTYVAASPDERMHISYHQRNTYNCKNVAKFLNDVIMIDLASQVRTYLLFSVLEHACMCVCTGEDM